MITPENPQHLGAFTRLGREVYKIIGEVLLLPTAGVAYARRSITMGRAPVTVDVEIFVVRNKQLADYIDQCIADKYAVHDVSSKTDKVM